MKCKNCQKLRKKIGMLEKLINISRPEEWDLDGTYKDILEGKDNGNEVEGLEPDTEFAKWFAKRYNLEGNK